jgi:hypothetical protein
MKTIELLIIDGVWVVRYPEEDRIKELFGSCNVPTSFPAHTPSDVVRQDVQRKNPTYKVIIKTSNIENC